MGLQIGGIASGMDTQSMVNELMKAEHMKVDKVYQQKQIVEWQRDDFRDINTKLLALRNSVFDMKLQRSFNTKKVSSSNESVLTATGSGDALEGNYSIKVSSLATAVTKASSSGLESADDKSSLEKQFSKAGLSGTVTFTLEGYVDGENKSKDFSFDTAETSINDVVKEINEANIGIKASYDETLDRFFLTSVETGSTAKVHAKADSESFLAGTLKLGLTVGDNVAAADQGTNAKVDFNGITGLEYSSNQFTLNGINFDLKSKGDANVSINSDIDGTVDKIKAFVESYNKVLDNISGKLSEKRERKFPPLTDAQKDDMTDKEIEKWEEKARSGLLSSDSLLNSAYNNIRMTAMDKVEGLSADNKYTMLSSIGINTAPYAYNEKGKLHIDEEDLRNALKDNPDGVMELFTGNENADGLADKLYDNINNSINSIKDKAGSKSSLVDDSFIGKELKRIDDRIYDLEDDLADKETFYWSKFTAMEKYMEQMNSQSAWLAQQLGGGQ